MRSPLTSPGPDPVTPDVAATSRGGKQQREQRWRRRGRWEEGERCRGGGERRAGELQVPVPRGAAADLAASAARFRSPPTPIEAGDNTIVLPSTPTTIPSCWHATAKIKPKAITKRVS